LTSVNGYRSVYTTNDRIARIDCASVVVIAVLGKVHATRGRIARIDCASIVVIAGNRSEDAITGVRVARIGCANIVVVADLRNRLAKMSGLIARADGAKIRALAVGIQLALLLRKNSERGCQRQAKRLNRKN
jgi:hypothetical protein